MLNCSPWLLVACAIVNVQCIEAFQSPRKTHSRTIPISCSSVSRSPLSTIGTRLFGEEQDGDAEEQVEVGTKEYYSGFLSSPIEDETVAERGSGLEQALKLGGGAVLLLTALFVGFMASNGLL